MVVKKIPIKRVITKMVLDKMTIISIALPVVIFYFIITGLPRGYRGIEVIYLYGTVLIAFMIYMRFDIAFVKIRVQEKSRETEELMKDVNVLLQKVKTGSETKQKPANPVLIKKGRDANKLSNEDCKDFQ